MSNKFTGITSGGQEIPVYDKSALHDAYSAGNNIGINGNVISVTGRKSLAVQSPLSAEVSGNSVIISLDESAIDVSSKLDTSAFAEVSGSFLTSGDLDGYATEGFVESAVSGKADTSAIPSLDGYATEQWVGEQGYLTAVPEGYATTEDVISATSGKANTSALTAYQTKNDMTAYVPVSGGRVSGLIISAGSRVTDDGLTYLYPYRDYYLSATLKGVDITAYQAKSATWETVTAKADTTALEAYQTIEGMSAYQPSGDYQAAGDYYSASNPSGFISSVPDTYLQNTDLTIVDNKVTEISGVPLSAGDELPATVMDTSGLEYNSQGYINGYNGSAVATIDQERQWFTHDDTLCHISNSAQYALGVNMSAISADLARMMGVDETVLLDRGTDDLTAPNTAQLSEPFSAFEKIEIWSVWNPWPTNVPQATYYPGTATNGSYMVWDNSQYMRAGYGKWAVNGTTFQLVSASQTTNWPTFDSPQTGLGGIRKIVGIGRKN